MKSLSGHGLPPLRRDLPPISRRRLSLEREFSWTLADNAAALTMRALVTGATGFLGAASLDLDRKE